MTNVTDGLMPIAKLFDEKIESFLVQREELQRLFISTRFEVLEAAYQLAGTTDTFVTWLTRQPPYRLWSMLGDRNMIEIIYAVSGLEGSRGLQRYVSAMNQAMSDRDLPSRLIDVGGSLLFVSKQDFDNR